MDWFGVFAIAWLFLSIPLAFGLAFAGYRLIDWYEARTRRLSR